MPGAAIDENPAMSLLRAAVDWRVRLDSGLATDADHQALQDWLSANPAHREAWRRVDRVATVPVARIRDLDARHEGVRQASYQVLTQPEPAPSRTRRRTLQGGLAMLALGSGAIVLDDWLPPRSLLADWHTRTAERRRITLADGSALTLDARSSADFRADSRGRELTLLGGQCVVEIGDGPQPFVLRAGPARLRVAGAEPARIAARLGDARTSIAVLAGHASWLDRSGVARPLTAGQSLGWRHDDARIEIGAGSDAQAAWTDGVLDVRNAPLGEVVAALRPYQHGLIRISERAAALRVFGVFPLDEPQRALRMLADALPIAVTRFSGWITWINAR
ncbi:MAG: DUF4880 domain-containing protein [Burkholderiaceae bacterium]